MSEVRLRTRGSRGRRVREFQGMLAMQGLDLAAEPETTTVMDRRSAGQTRSGGTAPRRGRATDVKPLPYRMVLPEWPDEWRERWGRRANAREDAGLSWRDAKGRAFVEIRGQLRAAISVERN